MSSPPLEASGRRPNILLLFVALAVVGLAAYPLIRPELVQDDFQILARGATWERTRTSLWEPQNEHAMPLGRLLTFALMHVGGRATVLPWTAGAVGPIALLLALPLVYHFVRRECGHPLHGLVAAALFGVTSVYQQAVYWFAASFSILALDTMLLALLAAQRWKETGRGLWLDLSALCCFLALGWFASGVLAGPLCCLYLLWPRRSVTPTVPEVGPPPPQPMGRRSHWTLVPLLGTLLFVAVLPPRTLEQIEHVEHYAGETAQQRFDPWLGLVYTGRSILDNLLLGLVGVSTVEVPKWLVPALLGGVAAALAWWWRRAPNRRLVLLGVGMIVSAYLLVYSARAWVVPYDGRMTQPSWSRYHLLPQLGLALVVVGGMSIRGGLEFTRVRWELVSRVQARRVTLLVAVLFVVQLPRAILGAPVPAPGLERFASSKVAEELHEQRGNYERQRAVLRDVAVIDDRCREYRISADVAVDAMAPMPIPWWFTRDANALKLLRGSDEPLPRSAEEVRELLNSP
jgi:hypothetical protein